jgi:hypothetical protein
VSGSLETHVRLVGGLHIAFGALIALALAALVTLGWLTVEPQGGLTLPAGVTAAMIATLLAILAALHLAAGIGLLRFRRWARSLVFVLSFVALLNIPLGTAVGGYSLWVLYHTRGW